MHAKSGLRVLLKWRIYRPDSVIAAVIPLGQDTAMNYAIAKKFAPPAVDLRAGRIADDGDERLAKRPIRHRDPYDVSCADLEYYFDVWGFLTPEDLLFYSYPVARFLGQTGQTPVYYERWVEALNSRLEQVINLLNPEQLLEFRSELFALIPPDELPHFKQLAEFTRSAG